MRGAPWVRRGGWPLDFDCDLFAWAYGMRKLLAFALVAFFAAISSAFAIDKSLHWGVNRASGAVVGKQGFSPISPANDLSDLSPASAALTNLGFGALATQSTVDLSSQATGALPAARFSALTVTNSAGSLATSIAAGALTNSKIASRAAAASLGFTPLNPNTFQAANAPHGSASSGGALAPPFRGFAQSDIPAQLFNGSAYASAMTSSSRDPAYSNVFDAAAAGMVGNGTTDNTTAFRSLVTAATAGGGRIHFPCGIYKFTGSITGAINNNQKLVIEGDGSACTYLFFSRTNGISLTYNGGLSTSDIKGLTFTTDGTAYNGLVVAAPNGTGGGQNSDYLTDVVFQGDDFVPAGGTHFWAQAMSYVGVSGLVVYGGGCNGVGTSGNCYYYTGANCSGSSCTNAYAVGTNFISVGIVNCNVGINVAEWWQGITINQANITGCNKGVTTGVGSSTKMDGLELLAIGFSQFNTYMCDICENSKYFLNSYIIGNHIIVEPGGIGIIVEGASNIISSNAFSNVGGNNATAIEFAVSDPYAQSINQVQGNIITGFRYAYHALASVNASVLIGNNYATCYYSGASCAVGSVVYKIESGAAGIFIDDPVPTFYAQLPACNSGTIFSTMLIVDDTSATYQAVPGGGGAYFAHVGCDGSNWHNN
jgi:hypothetical protein